MKQPWKGKSNIISGVKKQQRTQLSVELLSTNTYLNTQAQQQIQAQK